MCKLVECEFGLAKRERDFIIIGLLFATFARPLGRPACLRAALLAAARL